MSPSKTAEVEVADLNQEVEFDYSQNVVIKMDNDLLEESGDYMLEDGEINNDADKDLSLPLDENELLKSPSKDKPILKRKRSISPINFRPVSPIGNSEVASSSSGEDVSEPRPKIIKISAITWEERLQMRAKKFGIEENKLSNLNKKISSGRIPVTAPEKDPAQIVTHRKRAERFGSVAAPAVAQIAGNKGYGKRKPHFRDVRGSNKKKSWNHGNEYYSKRERQQSKWYKLPRRADHMS